MGEERDGERGGKKKGEQGKKRGRIGSQNGWLDTLALR